MESGPAFPFPVMDVAAETNEKLDRVQVGVADRVLKHRPPVLVHGTQITTFVHDETEEEEQYLRVSHY